MRIGGLVIISALVVIWLLWNPAVASAHESVHVTIVRNQTDSAGAIATPSEVSRLRQASAVGWLRIKNRETLESFVASLEKHHVATTVTNEAGTDMAAMDSSGWLVIWTTSEKPAWVPVIWLESPSKHPTPLWLTSTHTHIQGLVTEEDLSSRAQVAGTVDWNAWQQMYQSNSQKHVIWGYLWGAYGGALGLLLVTLWNIGQRPALQRWLHDAVAFLLLLPTLFLWGKPLTTVVVAAALATGSRFIRNSTLRFAVLSSLLPMFVLSDAIFHWGWSQSGLLSYDLVQGVRFYGIGNEYMALSIGSLLFAGGAFSEVLQKAGRPVTAAGLSLILTLVAVIFVMADPWAGANAGGVWTSVAALGAWMWFQRRRQGGSVTRGLLTLGMVTAATFMLFYWNAQADPPTHVTQAVTALANGQLSDVTEIAVRKLELNLSMIGKSIIGPVFLVMWGIGWAQLQQRRGSFYELIYQYEPLRKAVESAFFAALVGLLFNDTGIAVSALILTQVMIPTLAIVKSNS